MGRDRQASAANTPEEIARDFIATVNAHDVAATRTLLADDAIVRFGGLTPFEGPGRIGD